VVRLDEPVVTIGTSVGSEQLISDGQRDEEGSQAILSLQHRKVPTGTGRGVDLSWLQEPAHPRDADPVVGEWDICIKKL